MESLEDQVRESLINKKANEYYKLNTALEYKNFMINWANIKVPIIINAFNPGIIKKFGKDKKIGEKTILEYTSKILEVLDKEFSDVDEIKKTTRTEAETDYLKKDEVDGIFSVIYKELGGDNTFKGKIITMLRASYDEFNTFIDNQNKIVFAITNIAKTKGIETALIKKYKNEVTKMILPTKEEYVEHSLGRIILKESITDIQTSIYENGGTIKDVIISRIEQSMNEASKTKIGEKAKEKANEIYENDSFIVN
jgi:C-terminal processing protease CtpA/Prc